MREKLRILKFFFGNIIKIEPKVILLRGLYSIFQTIEIILVMYIPTILIILLLKKSDEKSVILLTLGLLVLLMISRITYKIIHKYAYMKESDFIYGLLRDISKKITTVPFELVEDATFVSKKEEALFPIITQGSLFILFDILPKLTQAILVVGSVVTILLVYQPLLIVFSILLAIIGYFLSKQMVNVEATQAMNSARQNREYVYYLRTMSSTEIAKDVRIYNIQSFFRNKIKSLFDNFVKISKRLYTARELRGLIGQVLSVILIGITYGFLIYLSKKGTIGIATFILLVNATTNFNNQINIFLSQVLLLNQQIIYLKPLYEFYQLVEEKMATGKVIMNEDITSIEFKNVRFRYPNTEKDVLNGCSFVVNNKMNLSIVGENGSGKTTIIKLLSRLYRPTEGEIKVNGRNIDEYEETSYLKQISVVFQDFKTFGVSLKENIVFDKEVNDVLLHSAVEQSHFDVELSKFSNGLDTKIASGNRYNDGIGLSKGQEQKLVIARNIYENGSLLILDEPTASLDPIAEEEVYTNFKEVTEGKLAIFISHRLSSCRFSDCIIYLEDGIVKESGNHNSLIEKQGKYAQLFALQANNYK